MKEIKLQKGEKYLIEWDDTYSFQGWHDDEAIDSETVKNQLQSTVGFYIKKDKSWLIFCMHYNPNEKFETYGIISWIPRGCIRTIKLIK